MAFLSMLLGLLLSATAFTGNKMESGGCAAPAAHHISGNRPTSGTVYEDIELLRHVFVGIVPVALCSPVQVKAGRRLRAAAEP